MEFNSGINISAINSKRLFVRYHINSLDHVFFKYMEERYFSL